MLTTYTPTLHIILYIPHVHAFLHIHDTRTHKIGEILAASGNTARLLMGQYLTYL